MGSQIDYKTRFQDCIDDVSPIFQELIGSFKPTFLGGSCTFSNHPILGFARNIYRKPGDLT
jgi:hypothetical protein